MENTAQKKDQATPSPAGELIKELKWLLMLIVVTEAIYRWLKFIFDVIADLIVLAWISLIIVGVWTDNILYLKIAGTVLLGGLLFFALGRLSNTFFRFFSKRKPKHKPDAMKQNDGMEAERRERQKRRMSESDILNTARMLFLLHPEIMAKAMEEAQRRKKESSTAEQPTTSESSPKSEA